MQKDEFLGRLSNWSEASGPDAATTTVDFEPRLDQESTSIKFVRVVRRGLSVADEHVLWERDLGSRRAAANVFDWMQAYRTDWPMWGLLTSLLGPEQLLEFATAKVAAARHRSVLELRAKRKKD